MADAGFYRLEAKIVKRSAGHSVVAKAAYIAREAIEDKRLGLLQDYSRHSSKPLFTGFYAAMYAPDWAQERAGFWNAVEAHETRKDAQLAREFIGCFPHQMQLEHARYAVQDFVRENFTRKGIAADVAIHPAHEHGDERNTHVHIVTPLRRLEQDGTWGKKAQQFAKDPDTGKMLRTDKDELQHLRERFAHHLNRQLERFGYDIRVDHRSYKAQGIDREPGVHLGKRDAAKERAGESTKRGAINLDITARNAERATLRRELAALEQEQARLEKEQARDERRARLAGNTTVQEIELAYAQSRTGDEFAAVLAERGLTVCRVTEEEAERSRTQRDWLGATPVYQAGEYLAVNERGQAYRLDDITIDDEAERITARLTEIDPAKTPTLGQAQDAAQHRREATPLVRDESRMPDGKAIARQFGEAGRMVTGVAGRFLGGTVRVMESVLGALSDFFTTGSGSAPPQAEPPPRRHEPVTTPQQKDETLRRMRPEEAARDPNVQAQARAGQTPHLPMAIQEMLRRRAREEEEIRRERDKDREPHGDRDKDRRRIRH